MSGRGGSGPVNVPGFQLFSSTETPVLSRRKREQGG